MRSPKQVSVAVCADLVREHCSWEVSVPLLTNRFLLYDSLKGVAIAGAAFLALTAGTFWLRREPALALEMLPVLGIALLPILALLALSALVVMGNRWHVRFAIDGHGVHWAQLRPVRGGLLAALAAHSGQPAARGAAALLGSGDAGTLRWRDICKVREHADARVISLMNRWRVVLRLYCNASNYVQVAAIVREQVGRHRDEHGRKTR